MVQQKVIAFREFAAQLAAQVVEQMSTEFEREVSVLYNDVLMYRGELTRVAELLGHQLGRERQLHQMMEKMHEHSTNIASSTQYLTAQSTSAQQLHDVLDQVLGQHKGQIAGTLSGVNQLHSSVERQLSQAKQMSDSLITAENEFSRITQLLQTPTITAVTPAPTVAFASAPSTAPIRNPWKGSATPPASPSPPWLLQQQSPFNLNGNLNGQATNANNSLVSIGSTIGSGQAPAYPGTSGLHTVLPPTTYSTA
mmetsp:Transcript_136796/g.236926  ORF Transcript_136796/g.236926 Transcript_136796/m.236926 type:complete len:253 (-) Transcript_136796:146-904(-)